MTRSEPVRGRTLASAATLIVLLAACADEPAAPNPGDPFFQASVQGDVSVAFEGEGYFVSLPSWFRPRPGGSFHLMSVDLAGEDRYGFDFGMFGVSRPEGGVYALELPDRPVPVGTTPRWLWARFTVRTGSSHEVYHAVGGSIEVTESTDRFVAGTFEFTGVRTGRCERDGTEVRCEFRPPRSEDGEPTTIEVSGSFAAVPLPRRIAPPRGW